MASKLTADELDLITSISPQVSKVILKVLDIMVSDREQALLRLDIVARPKTEELVALKGESSGARKVYRAFSKYLESLTG